MQQTIEDDRRRAGARPPAQPDARHWVTALASPYREPSLWSEPGRALRHRGAVRGALWLLMLLSLRYSYWLCLFLAVPAAGAERLRADGADEFRKGPSQASRRRASCVDEPPPWLMQISRADRRLR